MEKEVIVEGKRPFLVDVPVRVNIWIRPWCQRAQFDVLKNACPSIIILQSDGGRNEKEWEAIYQNRRIFDEEIDWNCHVYKLYEESNLGLYAMGKKVSEFIWDRFDRCVFLEDDHVPAVSFFRYCAELLEKYKDDYRICRICGTNSVGTWDDASSDYFFSRNGSIWGVATWKRVYKQTQKGFDYGEDKYIMNLLEKHSKPYFFKQVEGYTKNKYYGGHVAGGEFWYGFHVAGNYQLNIIPRRNLISNIGYGKGSAHANGADFDGSIPKYMFTQTYEMNFPMKHPCYIIPDDDYSDQIDRNVGFGHPFLSFFRTLRYYFRLLYKGQFSYIYTKVKMKIRQGNSIEK